MTKPQDRFSNRVEAYVKYRPGYPAEILGPLREECGLTPDSVIADIGSGTGKLAEVFLANGNLVFAVEPNSPMRLAAEQLLGGRPGFKSIDGSAEATTLPAASVDIVSAGQSFHWFDQQKARSEFQRILKPGGCVAIIWNERRLDTTPFLRDYEKFLLQFGTDYKEVRHENTARQLTSFFAPGDLSVKSFDNFQEFDFDGVKGRVESSSYTPAPGTSASLLMLQALRELFLKYAVNDRVVVEYDTRVYFGRLGS